ncbi:MAG: hypothetical protein M1286_04425 [Candidatus Marsarchaeota archaeon]|nr:hypothetical protein [Candidatus Marsarchaeota archaeon]
MKDRKLVFVLLLVFSTLLGAAGQLFFKIGVTGNFRALVEFVALGMIVYGIATISYFYVLSRTHLSWAYGFTGLSYIFASVIAYLFLGEAVPLLRWDGIFLITIGTVLIGLS